MPNLILLVLALAFAGCSVEEVVTSSDAGVAPVVPGPGDPLAADGGRVGDGAALPPDAASPQSEAGSSDVAPPEVDAASSSGPDGGQAATECEAQGLAPGDHVYTLASQNGLTYTYTIVVPDTVDPQAKAPLALVWHGAFSSPEETRGLTHMDATMAEAGIISVHPESPDEVWDVGECCTQFVFGATRRDEIVFVKELLAEVEHKVCVDAARIYTTGFSNGGVMSQLLACEMADTFAASAPAASTLMGPSTCQPSRPVPMLMINGTDDPLVGYEQPTVSGGLPVPQAFAFWVKANDCTADARVTLQRGQATCRVHESCAGGAEVGLCTVEGMGHCLPGMKTESATNCLTKFGVLPLGMPNDDMDGVRVAVEFLTRLSLP